jgi:hypothetical protein
MMQIMDKLSPERMAELDAAWLDAEGRLRLLTAAEFLAVDHDDLKRWCHTRVRYGLPTLELIIFLKERIGTRKAIEIGAGNADLGRLLGITMTDSRVQERDPMVQVFYAASGQPVTRPPADVLTLNASDAVQRLHPKVVVASWVTRRCRPEDGVKAQCFAYGIDEEAIIRRVQCYIHIGSASQHGLKTALSLPHEEVRAPWIVSRAFDPKDNVIYIWGK